MPAPCSGSLCAGSATEAGPRTPCRRCSPQSGDRRRPTTPTGPRCGVALHDRPQRDRRRAPQAAAADPRRSAGRRSTPPDAGRRGRGIVERVAHSSRARGAARARADGDRARVLLRPLAERGRRVPADPARNRQDPHAQRTRAPRRRPGGRPDERSELSDAEVRRVDRARRSRPRPAGEVHELLSAAGPPPELPPSLRARAAGASRPASCGSPRRRYTAIAAVAIAATILFGSGYAVGARNAPGARPDRGHDRAGRCDRIDRPATEGCAGNWPMTLEVRGLPPLPDGETYSLWLTNDGKLADPCGSFVVRAVDDDGAAERAVLAQGVRRLGRRADRHEGALRAADLRSLGPSSWPPGDAVSSRGSCRIQAHGSSVGSTRTSHATFSPPARRRVTAPAPGP